MPLLRWRIAATTTNAAPHEHAFLCPDPAPAFEVQATGPGIGISIDRLLQSLGSAVWLAQPYPRNSVTTSSMLGDKVREVRRGLGPAPNTGGVDDAQQCDCDLTATRGCVQGTTSATLRATFGSRASCA